MSIVFIANAYTYQQDESLSKLQLQLDSMITHEHLNNHFDGTIVIGSQDTLFFTKAIGTANRVWDIPLELEHRFDICSINKSFISTLIMIAVEEGKIALDDRLVSLLSGFNYSGHFNAQITVHHLLTHTSGLPDYGQVEPSLIENNARLLKRLHFTNVEYVDFISQLQNVGEPDEQFYYSNFGYHLLTIILEDIYGQPFPQILNDKIIEPLSLKHTFSTVSNTAVFENLVEAYNYDSKGDRWNRNQFIDLTIGRRIFSTAYDLYLWGREMSAPSLISKPSNQLMLTNHTKQVNADISYGYGWAVFDGLGSYKMGNLGIDRRYIIHGGSTEGYKSMLVNIENGQYIITFLTNIGDQTNEIDLARKIVHILINSENE